MACENCPPPAEPEKPGIVGWRAWYDDGSIYDSISTAWADLPGDGLLHVVLFDARRNSPDQPRIRHMLSGYDYYFQARDRLTGEPFYGGNNESIAAVERRYLRPVIKRGRWAGLATLTRVNAEAAGARWHDDP